MQGNGSWQHFAAYIGTFAFHFPSQHLFLFQIPRDVPFAVGTVLVVGGIYGHGTAFAIGHA